MKYLKFTALITMAITAFILLSATVAYSQTKALPKGIADVSFTESQKQVFKPVRTYHIALTDLDKDGDLDAIFSNMGFNAGEIWMNNGDGTFKNSGQQLTQLGHGIGLGDLDDDGDLDLFVTCAGWVEAGVEHKKPSKIYFNKGKGVFIDSGQELGDANISGNSVSLADIDSDGDLDAAVIYNQEEDKLYLNDGKGNFTKSSIKIPEESIFVDLDADGDPDIFQVQRGKGYQTLLNNGKGSFTVHGLIADTSVFVPFAGIGDLDNDGDPDVIVTNGNRMAKNPTKVLLNDGTGRLKDSGQQLTPGIFGRVGLGDLNGDGSLDAVITGARQPAAIWLNNGKGTFYQSSVTLKSLGAFHSPRLKDIDEDGDVDIMIANFIGGSNKIWLNNKIKGDSQEKKEKSAGAKKN
ncbi:MAG: VCBS repeat-containing protein [bacterium]|nr:VCBS repeat-containing protein [bacterium]